MHDAQQRALLVNLRLVGDLAQERVGFRRCRRRYMAIGALISGRMTLKWLPPDGGELLQVDALERLGKRKRGA